MSSLEGQQQKDLFTKRWRKVQRIELPEHRLQIALVQHLLYRARRGVIYFHCPNGELRDKRTAAKLKAMGTLPGVSDLIFVWRDADSGKLHNLFLELKARRGVPSIEQQMFGRSVEHAGAHYRIAYSLDEALELLKNFDLIKS